MLPVGTVEVVGRLLTAGDGVELRPLLRRAADLGRPAVSLLVDVDAAPGVAPAWGEAAVDVPPPAELVWTAVGPDGTEAAVDVEDSTGGLRRSGLLWLDWPAVWNAVGRRTVPAAGHAPSGELHRARRGSAASTPTPHRRRTCCAARREIGDQLGGLAPLARPAPGARRHRRRSCWTGLARSRSA